MMTENGRKETDLTRREVIGAIESVRLRCIEQGLDEEALQLSAVLGAFSSMTSNAASILGAMGGRVGGKASSEAKTASNREKANLPPKEGKNPRGRPRKAV